MQVWNVLHAARLKYKTQKIAIWHHRKVFLAISLQLRHVSTIRKKLATQQYLFHLSSHYGELRPTNGWDRFGSLGHPSKFQPVLRLGFITAPTSFNRGQQNFGCLVVSCVGTLYIFGSCSWPNSVRGHPYGIWPAAKSTLRPSLAFSCIGTITARHSSSGRQPNFVAWYKEWNYGTFAESATYIWLCGHHVGHRSTF